MKLYTYYRSSAAYRVRIALNLKGIDYDSVPIDLLAGQQTAPHYRSLNPQGLVPAMEQSGQIVSQSLAIIEYLEEEYPEPALLPQDAFRRARARSLAYAIACDTHPLNNMSVLNFLRDDLKIDQAGRDAWYAQWVHRAFAALETAVVADPYCMGSRVTIADICLVPQMFNARRFAIDLAAYPRLVAIDAAMQEIEAVAAAHPSRQVDAPADESRLTPGAR